MCSLTHGWAAGAGDSPSTECAGRRGHGPAVPSGTTKNHGLAERISARNDLRCGLGVDPGYAEPR